MEAEAEGSVVGGGVGVVFSSAVEWRCISSALMKEAAEEVVEDESESESSLRVGVLSVRPCMYEDTAAGA